MTWAIVLWSLIMGGFALGQLSQFVQDTDDHDALAFVLLWVGVWFIGFLVLAIVWFMSAPRRG